MIAYVDAAVVLRLAFGEAHPLNHWEKLTPISSALIKVECLGTVERSRARRPELVEMLAERRAAVLTLLSSFSLIEITSPILERASNPFPTAIPTLDAIHLSTALELRDEQPDLVFATHDVKLAVAARSMGFAVVGD